MESKARGPKPLALEVGAASYKRHVHHAHELLHAETGAVAQNFHENLLAAGAPNRNHESAAIGKLQIHVTSVFPTRQCFTTHRAVAYLVHERSRGFFGRCAHVDEMERRFVRQALPSIACYRVYQPQE